MGEWEGWEVDVADEKTMSTPCAERTEPPALASVFLGVALASSALLSSSLLAVLSLGVLLRVCLVGGRFGFRWRCRPPRPPSSPPRESPPPSWRSWRTWTWRLRSWRRLPCACEEAWRRREKEVVLTEDVKQRQLSSCERRRMRTLKR